ncbi:general secretion pathway protein GspM [Achromobacter spanius]|uniref:General secretion pathway protein GspM n=1 Tax=Achromobacter spanius TaxID=217203 RepID=A0A2S5GM93_9BURK|nr:MULTISPECIES: type II secretion system protein GspM [Achromobacter]AYD64215.1 type II secretion system protein M [Achromobacter sp. B7]PPA74046.1 general secretion pathway protein GspM [Achromobacter spanius]
MTAIERLHRHWQTAAGTLRKTVDPTLTRARQRYQALAPRERRLVTVAGALVGVAVIFVTLIEPPLKTVRKLQAELPALRGQAATVADLTMQARALRQRSATPVAVAPTPAELSASLEGAALPAAMWSLGQPESGKGVRLTLNQAPSSALLRWLDGAARDWGLQTQQVELTRATNPNGRPLPGLVNGHITLTTADAGASH